MKEQHKHISVITYIEYQLHTQLFTLVIFQRPVRNILLFPFYS